MNPIYRKLIFWSVLGLVLVILVLARRSAGTSSSVISTPAVTPASIWVALMEREPFDYFTPLPPAVQSPLDGTYGKIDQSPPQWWKCLRCADYRVSGGIWKLQFDAGVMRIFYDVTAIANTVDGQPPDGIEIDYHPGTIGYGIHRVLWWNGDWIEASTDLYFKSMGVQILGESVIGWARVLFDGVEVWRGNTAQIWSKSGRHGGYIEISGYEHGRHTIRVESLNFDYHPVTIAGFGFSYEEGVQVEDP